jgi:hypothetical protein
MRTSARFCEPLGMCLFYEKSAPRLAIVDSGNHIIRFLKFTVDDGVVHISNLVTTSFGGRNNVGAGHTDGLSEVAQFNSPTGIHELAYCDNDMPRFQ